MLRGIAPIEPDTPRQQPKPPHLIWKAGAAGAVLVLITGFVITFQLARGVHPPTQTTSLGVATGTSNRSSSGPGSGSAPTSTSTTSPLATATNRPGATATPVPQESIVNVTQNQDRRPTCLDQIAPYTVQMSNAGTVSATWTVVIPLFASVPLPAELTAESSWLTGPQSSAPAWATANPTSGTIAAGQTASFVMNPVTAIPCGGTTYTASIQVRFAGGWQPDIPLTYAGTGSAPYSQVVLVSGSLNITSPCPASGTAPAPFTFAIKNTGNATAYPSLDTTKDTIGPNIWADSSITYDPPNPAVTTWLYPGEIWTVTITPHAGVSCNGTAYHAYVYINNAQGTSSTMTFSDTFQ